MERERWTHPTPHRGLCWGSSLLSACSCPGLMSVPATCGRGGWEMSMNRMPCRKELVQSNERNPQSILEKQKGNTWTRVVPYCSSLGTSHLLPVCQSSVWQEGHKRGSYPCKAHFSSLCMGNCPNSWVTFSPFSRPELSLCPQTPASCKPRAALSLTCEGHMSGQPPVARAHPALPLSTCSCMERQQPAEVLTEDPRAYPSWRTGAVTSVMETAYCN